MTPTRKADFSRVRKVLMLEGEPDFVPLGELAIDKKIKESFLGKEIKDLKIEIEFWTKAGYDFFLIEPSLRGRSMHFGLEQDGWAPRKGVSNKITNEKDFEEYPWPVLDEVDFSSFEEARKYLPDRMEIIGFTSGIYENVWTLMGFESFAMALVENPGLIEKMFDRVGNLILEVFKKICSYKVGAMWIGDDIAYDSGLMISPDYLRRYLFPYFGEMGKICRKKNLPFIYHSDGNLYGVIEDLVNIGFNALTPIDPNAMDIFEFKRKFGDKFCLMGNINVDTLSRGTPGQVKEEVRKKIEELAPGGGYILGSSNSVPDYASSENYRAMIDAALEYGKYPIKI